MSRYGIDYYGLGYYGNNNPIKFDASPFTASSGAVSTAFTGLSNYGTITLNWNDPGGNWAKLIVVRNTYGFPVNPYDGNQILEASYGSDPTFVIDTNLVQGAFYYYSIFVYNLTQYTWSNAGNAIGLSVQDYGNTDKMYNYLPEIYKITDVYTATSDWDNPDLRAFLSNFSFQLDYEQTIAALLFDRYNIQTVSGQLVPTMLNQFGQAYEPAIGLQQNRVLLRDSVILTKQRGSKQGLVGYLEDFSGWAVPSPLPKYTFTQLSTGQYSVNAPTSSEAPNPSLVGITTGHNLMLDYNDSSFEESTGSWVSTDGTADYDQLPVMQILSASITSNVATINVSPNYNQQYDVGNFITISGLPYPLFNSTTPVTITAVTPTSLSFALTGANMPTLSGYNTTTSSYGTVSPYPAPWSEPTAPSLFPNKTDGIIAVYNLSTSPQTINAFCGDDAPVIKGVPVTAGTTYCFSVYAAIGSGSTARNVTAKIKWFNRFGALLSTSSGSSVSDNTATFNASYRPYVSAAAPTGAYYACPGVSITSVAGSASNEHHFFDAAQFEVASTPSSFDEARQLHITLRANRINELINPHFASPITPWAATGASTTVDTTVQEPGTDIYTVTYTAIASNVATVTLSGVHVLKVGATVNISGITGTGVTAANYNGQRVITSVSSTSFSYSVTAGDQAAKPTTGTAWVAGNSLKLTATGTSVTVKSWDGSTTSQLMGIYYPQTSYTFSTYALANAGTENVTVAIDWYDSTHTLISTTTGASTVCTAGTWARPYVTSTAPSNAAYAAVQLNWTTTSGHILRLDEALFENSGALQGYFDGNGFIYSGNATDYFWEGGTVNGGRSHFYKNRYNVEYRLYTETLSNQVPLGTTYALYLGQPQT